MNKELQIDPDQPTVPEKNEPTEPKAKQEPEVQIQQVSKPAEQVAIEEGVEEMIFDIGWFDSSTGKVDFSKIKNDEVKKGIEAIVKSHTQAMQTRDINDAISSEIANYNLNISPNTLKMMIDKSNIKIADDGKVTGVKEAIESIKKAEPGLFKDKKEAPKEPPKGPLDEGFAPVEKQIYSINNELNMPLEDLMMMEANAG